VDGVSQASQVHERVFIFKRFRHTLHDRQSFPFADPLAYGYTGPQQPHDLPMVVIYPNDQRSESLLHMIFLRFLQIAGHGAD
jgi:hypothetical protein